VLGAKVASALNALGVLSAPVDADDALTDLPLLPTEHLDGHGAAVPPVALTAEDGREPALPWRSEATLNKLQHDSMVGHLALLRFGCTCKMGDIPTCTDRQVAIELCAGRGRLSGACQAVFDCAVHPLDLVLVDRAVVKHCGDAALVAAAASPKSAVHRIAADLADVQLSALPAVLGSGSSTTVAVHGKHTCGEAADLALRAVTKLQRDCDDKGDGAPSLHVAFSMCCHHLCKWESIYGREHLSNAGITRADFDVLRRCATLYRAHPRRSSGGAVRAQRTAAGQLACARAELGIAAKRLINEARAAQLRIDTGGAATVRLVEYVDESVTPENTMLLASTLAVAPLRDAHLA
jgi:hypothetical protein